MHSAGTCLVSHGWTLSLQAMFSLTSIHDCAYHVFILILIRFALIYSPGPVCRPLPGFFLHVTLKNWEWSGDEASGLINDYIDTSKISQLPMFTGPNSKLTAI